MHKQLTDLGVSPGLIQRIADITQIDSIQRLEALLGKDDVSVASLKKLWQVAEGYRLGAWLELDTTVVRGLSYYTGGSGCTWRGFCCASCCNSTSGTPVQFLSITQPISTLYHIVCNVGFLNYFYSSVGAGAMFMRIWRLRSTDVSYVY